jgi:hypothetical protein
VNRSNLARVPITTTLSRLGRWAFLLTALLAIIGVGMQLTFDVLNTYPPLPSSVAHSFGMNASGFAGVVGRVLDTFSYFTNVSNIVVAVVLIAMARGLVNPNSVWRALRMDSLVLISVTGLVYAIVLAPGIELRGWEHLENALVHIVVPILTVLTFLIWGPRGWLTWRTVFTALILPIIWLVFTLVRGAVIEAYPYPFLNVANLGLGAALFNVVFVLVLGVILGFIFLGLDRILMRMRRA